MAAPPGWYPQQGAWRWWDGATWGPFAPGQVPAWPPGPPRSDEDAGRNVAILVELWPLAFVVMSCLAPLAPLAIYLAYKDGNRFVRHHAAEATNAALTAAIIAVPLLAVGYVSFFSTIFTDFSSPDSGDAPPAVFFVGLGVAAVTGLVYLGLAIFGAVRASNRVWWRHPLAIPFIRAHRERVATRPLA